MCRNIKTLFNFDPPATEDEIRASASQFVRKISGFTRISEVNQAAYNAAVEEITRSASSLLAILVTSASPRNREIETARAHARAVQRFGEGK